MQRQEEKEWSAFVRIIDYTESGELNHTLLVENLPKLITDSRGRQLFDFSGKPKSKPYGWSLPGGGLKAYEPDRLKSYKIRQDYCETAVGTALRELFQETGLVVKNLKITDLLETLRELTEVMQNIANGAMLGYKLLNYKNYIQVMEEYAQEVIARNLIHQVHVEPDEEKSHLIHTFEIDLENLSGFDQLGVQNDLAKNTTSVRWFSAKELESISETWQNNETPEYPIYKAALARLGYNPWVHQKIA